MPKDTYHNLPEEKREAILEVALDEFADHSFNQASINRIVSKSKISKGSFYQYFDGKKDLFKFIIQRLVDKKIRYLAPTLEKFETVDFFTAFRELSIVGIKFAEEHRRYLKIGNWLLANKEAPIFKELVAESWDAVIGFFTEMLEKARLRGEIREDMDLGLLSHLLATMLFSLLEYSDEEDAEDFNVFLNKRVDLFMELLKSGLSPLGESFLKEGA